jgi:hypothetical protein
MRLQYLLAGAALATCMVASAASADILLGSEGSSGFVGALFTNTFDGGNYQVASDGESPFDPFGAGYDTSDGVDFSKVAFEWDQAENSHWNALGNQKWVLPASTACGVENEPHCEPVGHFTSPLEWNTIVLGTYIIREGDGGGISDRIVVSNIEGHADLKFSSDPGALPEPAVWSMMLTGFFGMGAMLRRRKQVTA